MQQKQKTHTDTHAHIIKQNKTHRKKHKNAINKKNELNKWNKTTHTSK